MTSCPFFAGQPAAAGKSRAAKSKAKAKAKAAAGGVQEVKAKTMDEVKAEICLVLNFSDVITVQFENLMSIYDQVSF